MKTLQQFLESSNPRIPRKKDNQQNLKNTQTYIQMKIQKEQYTDLGSKIKQQQDPVLQKLRSQVDHMLTRFRQPLQWSKEQG